jgi:hypothetical protein
MGPGTLRLETEKTPATRAGERLLWVGLTALGALFVAASFIPDHGWDLLAYWQLDPADPYGGLNNTQGSFNYSPPMVVLMAPLGLLPWPVLVVGWLAAQLACLYYIAGRWALALVLFPPVWLDITYGNINIFLAAMVVSSGWWFGLLTKVTPGVGIVWHAVRREWRPLAVTAAVTGGLVILSLVVLGPGAWVGWVDQLRTSAAMPIPADALPIPLIPRAVAAVLLIAWGAWTDRRWTVPVAVTLAMPVLWVIAFTPLIALTRGASPAGWSWSRPARRTAADPARPPSAP